MDNVTFEEDSRTYVNPQTGLTETESFIDTLRDVQAKNTAQINQNTYNLGSQVPSNIGGLGGSERLWQAQYQVPQVDAQVANLRATAQANALNQATQNLSDIYTNRYKQALSNYYARNKSNGSDSGTGSGTGDDDGSGAGLNTIQTPEGTTQETVRSSAPGTAVVWTGQYDVDGNRVMGVYDIETGKLLQTYAPGKVNQSVYNMLNRD